jgi:hypothetical protein
MKKKPLKQYVDRGETDQVKALDRMVGELSPWLTETEMDQCVELIQTLNSSEFGDINMSAGDAGVQLRMLLGERRYEEARAQWSYRNQHLITDGEERWIHVSTGRVYPMIPIGAIPRDYVRVLM